jgi:hypothetical protein
MASTLTNPDRPQVDDPAPLRAVHTANFPDLLRRLGVSLLVTTYQAGKLVMVRDCHLNGLGMEVFAVAVLPGRRWPELINDDDTRQENSFVVPDAALADVPAALRAPADAAAHAAGVGEDRAEPRGRS